MIASTLSATIGVLFGSAMFAFACFAIALGIGDPGNELSTKTKCQSDGSMETMMRILSSISKIGTVLAFVFLSKCYFSVGRTVQDTDFYFFTIGSVFAASFAAICRSQHWNEEEGRREVLLPRAQTDELKGIMQTLLLIGHFCEIGDLTAYAQLLFAGTFLWLTGFCHATYYLNTPDYSFQRATVVLLRTNLFALLLSLAFGEPSNVLLYPACLIHSIAYVLVYSVMALSRNGCDQRQQLRRNLSTSFGTLVLSSIVFSSFLPSLFLPTLFGVTFALNRDEITRQFLNLDTGPMFQIIAKRMVILIILVCVTIALSIGSGVLVRESPNLKLLSAILAPVAYIVVRNSSLSLREHTLALFGTIGSVSLELYVLHRHLYGSSTGFVGLASYPKVSLLVIGLLSYFAARTTKTATATIIGMWRLLPQSRRCVLQGLSTVAPVFTLCLLLNLLRFLSSISIAVMSASFGYTLFQRSTKSLALNSSSRIRYGHAFCFSATILVAVLFRSLPPSQSAFQIASRPLDKTCEKVVLEGSWVHVDTCSETVLGTMHQDFPFSSFGTCDSLQWAWHSSATQQHCTFTHRKPEDLLRHLRGRRTTFIGDSEIRHLFYAMCRSLGDSSAGAYNTTMEKHSDILREYGDVTMDFHWAPFVQNLSNVLETVIPESSPDAIVIGGGAWDRLHHFEQKTEQEILRADVASLANDLQILEEKISIVWVTPTTINTWALNTEQKRQNIREEQMQAFRELYKEAGIDNAVSFVFDGTAYTKHRVDECYDGVHYPFSVYDGGAQILANVFDWLLVDTGKATHLIKVFSSPIALPTVGFLEYLVLVAIFCMGLFAYDSFSGSLYIASVVWPELRPQRSQAFVRDETRNLDKESDEEDREVFIQ